MRQVDLLLQSQDNHVTRIRAGRDGEPELAEIERICALATDPSTSDGSVEQTTISCTKMYVMSSRFMEKTIRDTHADEGDRSLARIDVGRKLRLYAETVRQPGP